MLLSGLWKERDTEHAMVGNGFWAEAERNHTVTLQHFRPQNSRDIRQQSVHFDQG